MVYDRAAVKYKGEGCSTNFKVDGHHTKYTTRDPPPYDRTNKQRSSVSSERHARRARSEHGGVNHEQHLSMDERGMSTTASAAAFASSSSSSSSSHAPLARPPRGGSLSTKQSRGGGGTGGGAGGGKRRGSGKKKR